MLSCDEAKAVWEESKTQLLNEGLISEFESSIYLNKVTFSSYKDNTIFLSCNSEFVLSGFKKKLLEKFITKIENLLDSSIHIDFILEIQEKKTQNALSQTEIVKIQEKSELDSKPVEKKIKKQVRTEDNLKINTEFTFDNFIISQNNDFAANAAKTVAKNQATYNPLLIYGGVGLGKTHLMEAIGNEVLDTTNLKVIYVPAEDFLNEFIKSLYEKTMPQFKKKYRNVDYLLIDDIQIFENKDELQNEFFNTFNHLLDTKKQMVFTCDKHPNNLKNLTDRVRSRFGQGLTVDLKPPSYEMRYAILKKKLQIKNQTLPDDVIELIAKNISSNIRDLIAALIKLTAFSSMTNQVLTVEKAAAILEDSFSDKKQGNIKLDIILKVVAEYFDISVPDIRSKKRQQKISTARHYCMYLAKEMTDMSTSEIGDEIGNRDHTTVIHSCQKIEELIISDPKVEINLEQLKNKLVNLSK